MKKELNKTNIDAILFGLLFVLIGFIGLLNRGIIGQFFTYIVVYLFGAFHILFSAIIIFFGLYLMIKKKVYKIRLDKKLIGFFLMLLGISIAASLEEGLNVQNAYVIFSQHLENVQESLFHISSLSLTPFMGGGLIGYILGGLLNSCITEIGTKVVIAILIVVGFLFIFKNSLVRLGKFIINYFRTKRKAKREEKLQNEALNLELKAQKEEKALESMNKENIPLYRDDSSYNNYNNYNNQNNEQTPLSNSNSYEYNGSNSNNSNNNSSNDDNTYENDDYVPTRTISFFDDDRVSADNNTQYNDFSYLEDDSTLSYVDNNQQVNNNNDSDEEDEKDTYITPTYQNEDNNDVNQNFSLNNKVNKIENDEITSLNNRTYSIYDDDKNEEEVKKNKYVGPYIYPPINLLSDDNDATRNTQNYTIADQNVIKINEIFKEYNIGAQAISYTVGPSVTRYDIKVNPGVKLASLSSIQNELALKLGGDKTVRVELIIEGKDTSGIDIGNKFITKVPFKDVYKEIINNSKDKLLVPLGRNISGDVVKVSIDELPHLLVAGTTGSGKSVFIHSIIMTLIMRNTPDELRLLLIDPKRVEFAKYHDLPHLLCPIISDTMEATNALKRMVDEMERRYDVFATKGKGASKYSEYMEIADRYNLEKMPVIVMIVDEFADFVSQNSKEVEASIQRIAQKARAAGIYMILATQRPSVGFVSGDIKANIPSRIALSVATAMDSRVIIDENGAETLLGKGDLLARVPIAKTLIRVQSAFVDNKDIIAVCDFIREHSEVHYFEPFLDLKDHVEEPLNTSGPSLISKRNEKDPLHDEIKKFILETKNTSSSKITRYFPIGYARAEYILDCLEKEGMLIKLPNGRRQINEEYLTRGENDE